MSIMQEQKMIDESLLLRYFEKEVSEEEKQKVEEWIRSSEANSRMAKQVAQIFVATRLLHNSKEASPQQALQNFWSRVERRKHKHIWRYIGTAAAILALPVLILTTIYWFPGNSGGDTAIVWMEARGNDSEVCTVLLPDSSTVYLNSQAKLKYPTHFAKERRVYLDGEAYFVVRKQNGKRFIVHTVSEAEVEVLGTEFNVKTNRQGASTTLVSGAVKFISRTADKKERAVLIQPGQKISYDAETGKSKVEEVDIEREIGWKDGKIVLEDCPLQEALDILSKKYHVTFRIINDELQNSRFTGTIKNQGVEQIIKNLSISCRFNYRIVKNNSPGSDGTKATIELY